LPVVSTRHGAIPEGMVDGESGFLVPERNAEALAERLGYLATHPEIWPAMGPRGRSFVESKYGMDLLSRKLVSIYNQLIAPG